MYCKIVRLVSGSKDILYVLKPMTVLQISEKVTHYKFLGSD